jgi:hypothetical protein
VRAPWQAQHRMPFVINGVQVRDLATLLGPSDEMLIVHAMSGGKSSVSAT